MQPIIESDTRATKKFLYIFYDFESRQDTPCTGCIDTDDIKINCAICGVREFVFTRDPVKEMLGLCIRESTDFTEIIKVVKRQFERSKCNAA